MKRTPEPLCPTCRKPYPYGDPRSVIRDAQGQPVPCFDCYFAPDTSKEKKGD